ATSKVIRCSDSGEDAINQRDLRRTRGNEASHLCQDHDQRGLFEKDALAAHIRTRNDQQPVGRVIDVQVIWNETLAHHLNNRMAAGADFDLVSLVKLWANKIASCRDLGER